jgi:predicted nucleic acid-binding Zn ribbon protein
MQGIKASVKKKCPECKKLKLVRLIGSGSGAIFKGDGFYCNDAKERQKIMDGEGIVERKSVFSNKTVKKGPAKKNV